MKDGVVECPAEELRTFDVTEERANERYRGDDNGEVRLHAEKMMSVCSIRQIPAELTGPKYRE